jgi:DNA-binding transcriptional regulator YhcF (GntR family)
MIAEGPMILTRYTHRQVASMIGSNREAVTRAFAELQERGYIKVRMRYV